ncbi:Pumilio y domain member 6 [Coemansia thaxteri]|uniref:Pumilio y domain member 6 n=1 Tax=Coemansia thaxteri TaxID=2663907 RepID=A0A9W8BM54_9FUNG|nr:Pumilio y domain member 6 [Coemansia thaxteri]KAJ2008654.1 Pumilio y domain member 6 [Coemansia thaxteri]KAJ2472784.1 Pumilio y domain member 6 [Coemansia sp. RSA 2322]KAJ2485407.1 Pumilio y domain member 6 [Coemansia sp. RSA 2320]
MGTTKTSTKSTGKAKFTAKPKAGTKFTAKSKAGSKDKPKTWSKDKPKTWSKDRPKTESKTEPKDTSKTDSKGKRKIEAAPIPDDASRAQTQKRQRTERVLQSSGGDIKIEARRVWEQLRRGDIGSEERQRLMAEMMGLIGGRIKEITLKHDMSRVVQTCVKHGSAAQRMAIAAEVAGAEVELARSTYGRHILLRLLRHSPAARAGIIGALRGHVRRLVRHAGAAAVVDECYSVHANAAQRWALAAEFYGVDGALTSGLAPAGGGSSITSIDAVLAAAPERRAGVVAALRGAAAPLVADKRAMQLGVVHRVLLDLVRLSEGAARSAVIASLHDVAAEMVHTRDGAHCAMLCLLHGSARDRKALVRAFRPFVGRMARDEHAHAVLVGALDCVDDTVLAAKALLADAAADADALLADTHGRRVLLFAVAGRSPHYVGADALAVLRAGDAVRAATSKKDAPTRRRELAAAVAPALAAWAARNAAAAVFDALPSQAVAETLLRAPADKRAAWDAVLALVRRPVAAEGAAHVLLHPIANRVVSSCVLAGHAPPRAAAADAAPLSAEFNPPYAADVLAALEETPGELLAAARAGAFPVRALLEVPATAQRARELLRPHRAELEGHLGACADDRQRKTLEAIVKLL